MTDTERSPLAEAAHNKFLQGLDLTADEIIELEMVDRVRYCGTKYFPKGFSAGEVTIKLNSLLPASSIGGYTPMEVHAALIEFFGPPDQKGAEL